MNTIRENISISILGLVFVITLSLTGIFYGATSNTDSLKRDVSVTVTQSAIIASELMLEDIKNGKYPAR